MKPRNLYNTTFQDYDMRHDSPATRLLRKKERQIIEKFSTGTIIDFGCGTGYHLRPGIIGIDISEKMLSLAKKKSSVLQANESLPIKSNSIDTIYCFFTVLNMISPAIAREFHRVLKPGGRVLLSVASIFDNDGMREKTIQVGRCKMKLTLFSREDVEEMFSGFSLEYFDSLFSLVNPQWGNFSPLSVRDQLTLALERFSKKERGKMYVMVFKKI